MALPDAFLSTKIQTVSNKEVTLQTKNGETVRVPRVSFPAEFPLEVGADVSLLVCPGSHPLETHPAFTRHLLSEFLKAS